MFGAFLMRLQLLATAHDRECEPYVKSISPYFPRDFLHLSDEHFQLHCMVFSSHVDRPGRFCPEAALCYAFAFSSRASKVGKKRSMLP